MVYVSKLKEIESLKEHKEILEKEKGNQKNRVKSKERERSRARSSPFFPHHRLRTEKLARAGGGGAVCVRLDIAD